MKVKFTFILSIMVMIIIIVVTMLNSGKTLYNSTKDKTATIINEISPYETEYVYASNMSSNADPIVLSEGENGLDFTYDGLEYTHISDAKSQIVQVGTGMEGIYTGKLTGYGPDCPGCSIVGNVSCKTKEGTNHSLINDGIYYNDYLYGKVRILAADNSAFPCGTIVKVDNGTLEEFYGIVLDSGSSMRNAWTTGTVWMDLAFSSQADASKGRATSSNTKFNVQRWGW